jgi:anti-sigma B factor antagonist
MEITEQKIGSTTVIALRGRLSSENYMLFETKVNEVLARKEKNILIDCSNLFFITSSGIRVFVVLLKEIEKINGKLGVFSMADNIKEVFQIAELLKHFKTYNTLEEAIAGLSSN